MLTQTNQPDHAEPRKTDIREALYNSGDIGPIHEVQVSTHRIAQLRGLMLDLDLKLLRAGSLLTTVPETVRGFYEEYVRHWLSRNPVLAKAEVRDTGSGVHILLWFDTPIEMSSDIIRDRYAALHGLVRCALPTDPDQPGITGVTRPIGSINGKNGRTVTQLAAGERLTEEELLTLTEVMREKPFRTVFGLLTGRESQSPCPICRQDGSRLDALDRIGRCYGHCGKVTLATLYDQLLTTRPKGGAA